MCDSLLLFLFFPNLETLSWHIFVCVFAYEWILAKLVPLTMRCCNGIIFYLNLCWAWAHVASIKRSTCHIIFFFFAENSADAVSMGTVNTLYMQSIQKKIIHSMASFWHINLFGENCTHLQIFVLLKYCDGPDVNGTVRWTINFLFEIKCFR